MATQYKDGSFGETKELSEAMKEFLEAAEVGQARALYAGTPEEIEVIKTEASLEDQIKDINNRLKDIESENSVIEKPTLNQIQKITGEIK